MKLYLAGPLFTSAERLWNRTLAHMLVALGYEVWLPQEREPADPTAANLFAKNTEGIHWSDVIIANMDGPDPDSGTAWEASAGTHLGKLVLTYRTDFRDNKEGGSNFPPFNLMIAQSSCIVKLPFLPSVIDVVHALDSTLKKTKTYFPGWPLVRK